MLPPPTPPPPPSDADADPSPPVYTHLPVRYDQVHGAESSSTTSLIDHDAGSSSQPQLPLSPYLEDNFFDIAPRADATSFQVGYLGLEGFQSWIKGDVLVKLDPAIRASGKYAKCTISLTAEETTTSERVELFSAQQTLWSAPPAAMTPPVASTSRESAAYVESAQIPSTMPFTFPLTPDLPHCIHLPQGGITYALEARLVPAVRQMSSPDVFKRAPVHLTRYSPPGPLANIVASANAEHLNSHLNLQPEGSSSASKLRPHTWRLTEPVPLSIQLARTLFRRAEPIDIRIRIPPLPTGLQSEKALRLRAVEATLARVIHVRDTRRQEGDQSHKHQKQRADVAGSLGTWRASGLDEAPGYALAEDVSGPSSTIALSHLDEEELAPAADHSCRVEALLATSGKLCRFNSSRPILLRLALHPPFARVNMPFPHPDHDAPHGGAGFGAGRGGGGGCESITQETLAHTVTFIVRVKISMRGARSESRDVGVEKEITVIPGAAGAEAPAEDGAEPLEVPHARRTVNEKHPVRDAEAAQAGTSARVLDLPYAAEGDLPFESFDSEEEYDGFEDIGRRLDEDSDSDESADRVEAERLLDVLAHPSGSSADSSLRRSALQAMDVAVATRRNEQHAGEPPPSLLESQHDLQVIDDLEVEVAGVGIAMPRHHSDPRSGDDAAFLPPAFGSAAMLPHHGSDPGPPLDSDLSGYAPRDNLEVRSGARQSPQSGLVEVSGPRMPGQWNTGELLEATVGQTSPSPPLLPEWSESQHHGRLQSLEPSYSHLAGESGRALRHGVAQSHSPPSFASSVGATGRDLPRPLPPTNNGTPQPPPYVDGSRPASSRGTAAGGGIPPYEVPRSMPRHPSGVIPPGGERHSGSAVHNTYDLRSRNAEHDSSDRRSVHPTEELSRHPEYEAHALPPAYPLDADQAAPGVEHRGPPQGYEMLAQPRSNAALDPRVMADDAGPVSEHPQPDHRDADLPRMTGYGPPSYEA
ncbi:hypothetical protein IE81DRAFT_364630 [Ceraceosorus guamensis]|uniref:Uncharacterized protein n=1 Tax=Ceraceosorus guamensis TaxID=1522189 RepID=A0A316W742_9BASI|nr:hypothetical protein IE81DRAFT_364630 [Ceraceosorus guamensis]PWN44948.1 hypothetical protein IE81DRAFT_364630 [Ceraceosorus guamensis]